MSYEITIERGNASRGVLGGDKYFRAFFSQYRSKSTDFESIFLHGSNEHYVFADVIMGLRD